MLDEGRFLDTVQCNGLKDPYECQPMPLEEPSEYSVNILSYVYFN